jgi:hypothetical protein
MTTVAYSRGPENQLFFYLCGWRKFYMLELFGITRGKSGSWHEKPVLDFSSSPLQKARAFFGHKDNTCNNFSYSNFSSPQTIELASF